MDGQPLNNCFNCGMTVHKNDYKNHYHLRTPESRVGNTNGSFYNVTNSSYVDPIHLLNKNEPQRRPSMNIEPTKKTSAVPPYNTTTTKTLRQCRRPPTESPVNYVITIIGLAIIVLIQTAVHSAGMAHNVARSQQHKSQEAAKVVLIHPIKTTQHRQQQQQQDATKSTQQARPLQTNNTMMPNRISQSSLPLASLTPRERRTASPMPNQPSISGIGAETKYMVRRRPSWLTPHRPLALHGDQVVPWAKMLAENFQLSSFDSPILLLTKVGIMEGVRSVKFNKRLYTFLGIPYAKPPIGELRFQAPQPIESWSGIYEATRWPPFCMQPPISSGKHLSLVHVLSTTMSEDCLYMNIWTPSLKFRRNHKRPVMVWFHGGAFQYGGASVDENDGSALALLGDVVVVTFNYRLGLFGFLNANNLERAPNNVGLLDQRLVLEWVQDNIKSFGGDPQQVTIFGESAGGHSVGLHLISPKSYGLFKRVIMQSGVPSSSIRDYDTTVEMPPAIALADLVGCYGEQIPTNATTQTPIESKTTLTTTALNENTTNAASMSASSEDPDLERLNDASSDFKSASAASAQNGAIMNERLAKRWQSSSEGKTESSSDPSSPTGGDDESDAEYSEDEPFLDNNIVACLRNKTATELLKSIGTRKLALFYPNGNDLKGFFPNGPIMESLDSENLKIGPQKEFLIGVNSDEGAFFIHYALPNVFPAESEPAVSNMEDFKSVLGKEFENLRTTKMTKEEAKKDPQNRLWSPFLRASTSMISNIMTRYNGSSFKPPLSKASAFGKGVGNLITDIIFVCPSRSIAKTLSEAQRSVYFYLYDHRSSQTPYHPWMGVTHHDEVEFVFGRPLRMADTYSGLDVEMSQRMIKIWSYFAHTGRVLDQFNITWPKFGPEDNYFLKLNADHSVIGSRYHDKACNIYDTVISVHLRGN